MDILLITPNSPYPPQQGAALRNLGLLHSLKALNARVTLLSFCEHIPEAIPERLALLCDRIEFIETPSRHMSDRIRDLVTSDHPDLARRLNSAAFREKLVTLLHERTYDLIQFEGLEMAVYAPLVRQHQPNAKLVYDAHNAEFALQRNIAQVEKRSIRRLPGRIYSQIQAARIMRFERRVCALVNGIIAVSDDDAGHLRTLGTGVPVFTLPNGIFVDDYVINETAALNLAGMPLVFTGKMDYRPNVDAMTWFIESILPAIHTVHPDAHLYIVGQHVHRNLLQYEATTPNIAFTRWVESVVPFLHRADIFIAPLRMGSGTRLKILEAMAAGCAIVATDVAISGLSDEVRDALIVANDAPAFSQAVNALLQDSGKRALMGEKAHTYVRACYDWSILTPHLRDIYREIGIG